MSVLSISPFKACSPPVELLDYPLFFPKPNFRGRPSPADEDEFQFDELPKAAEIVQPAVDTQKKKFNEYSSGKNTITAQGAGDLSRSLGFAPSQSDLAALHSKYGDNVTFDQFQDWQKEFCIPHKQRDTIEGLQAIFATFDPAGTGSVSRNQVKTLLKHYGEGLTEQEIDTLLTNLGMTGDRIAYGQFVEALVADE